MSVAQNTASGIIKSVLIQLEQRLDIKVLMAAEAGSRAWGFASPDSDYDVRFIYCRPVDRYLTVNKRRDVLDINTPELTEVLRDLGIDTDIMDFAGWDADKAVYQMSKSNPQVLEWTNSPIIYRPNAHLVALAEKMYNPIPVMHHYRSMAKGNFREYLQGNEVWYKKYLYVIRPIMAAQFTAKFGTPAPVSFSQLRDAVEPAKITAAVDALLEIKMRTGEKKLHPRVPILNEWIEEQLEILETIPDQELAIVSPAVDLDQEFRDILYFNDI